MSEPVAKATPQEAFDIGSGRVRRRPAEWLPLVASILALIAVATIINLRKSIWADEAITMDQTGRTFGTMLDLVREKSSKPPVYYIVVWWWRKIWPSLEGVRAYSALCTVLAVIALDRAGRVMRLGRGILGLGVLAALTAHIAWTATEARAYGMALFFIACAIWLFVRVWLSDSVTRTRDSILFVLACYGALLTFYYSGFVVAGLFAGGMLIKGRRRLVACGVALTALMIPWSLMIGGHASDRGTYQPPIALGGEGPVATVGNTVAFVAQHLSFAVHKSVPIYQSPRRQLVYLGLIVLILIARLWQTRGRLTDVERWATATFAVSLGGLLVMRYTNRWTVDVRHWTVVAIPVLVCGAVLASRLQSTWMARAAQALLLCASLAGFTSLAKNERGTTDWLRSVPASRS